MEPSHQGRDVTIPPGAAEPPGAGDPAADRAARGAAVDDPPSPAYAVLPPGARRGVVVIHEIYGRQPEIDRVVERFGRAGYAAVAPDLFHQGGRLTCLRQMMHALSTGQGPLVRQALRARRWLCQQAGLKDSRIGVIGFCLGGGFALAIGKGFGAVSTNYGEIPPQHVMHGIGPVIGCYGGRDLIFRGKAAELKARLEPLGNPVETHLYPSAGHAFLTDGAHPVAAALSWPLMHVRYDPAVAEEAWAAIFAFFEKHL